MISVVINSIDVARFDAVSEQFRLAMGSEPYEIIRIPNARSMCEGYNRGLSVCRGDIVIFCHDDIEIWSDQFPERLKGHLRNFDVIGVAGTSKLVYPGWIAAGPPHIFGIVPHRVRGEEIIVMTYGPIARAIPNIQALDGLFLAFRRQVIDHLRWDEQTFTHFHCYDIDCTYRAFLAGYQLAVVNDMPIMHMSGGSFDDAWEEQGRRLMNKFRLPPVSLPSFPRMSVTYPNKQQALAALRSVYAAMP